MPSALEADFHEAMVDVYTRAKSEAGYNATRFRKMVWDQGGLATAHYLLRQPTISEGYAALWQLHRLDLTVEAVVLQPKWHDLFTPAERNTAITRLREYGFTGPLPEIEAE